MPQGWGDSQPCTDSARIDVSDAQVGTKKRALRSNQETDEGKLAALANSLTKKTPYKGPGADSVEKHEPASGIDTAMVDSLKVLDLERPIREADSCTAAKFHLFDHVVGSGEEGRRDVQAHGLRGLEIED